MFIEVDVFQDIRSRIHSCFIIRNRRQHRCASDEDCVRYLYPALRVKHTYKHDHQEKVPCKQCDRKAGNVEHMRTHGRTTLEDRMKNLLFLGQLLCSPSQLWRRLWTEGWLLADTWTFGANRKFEPLTEEKKLCEHNVQMQINKSSQKLY